MAKRIFSAHIPRIGMDNGIHHCWARPDPDCPYHKHLAAQSACLHQAQCLKFYHQSWYRRPNTHLHLKQSGHTTASALADFARLNRYLRLSSPVPKATPGVSRMFIAEGSVGSLHSGTMYRPSDICNARRNKMPGTLHHS